MKNHLLVLTVLVLCPDFSQAQTPTKQIVYKTTPQGKLHLHVFEPKGHKASDKRPTIVFFFGGGWVGGTPKQFYPHAKYLASRGMLAMAAEYRIRKTHKTTPFECIEDGKSAIRYVRANATKLGVDPDHLAAGGGSAGGHVAAATGTLPGLDAADEDKAVSSKPTALVLFNPVYDNGPKGYGYDRVKDRFREISPMHNLTKETPPAIVFLGTKDKLIPVATGKEFQQKMKDLGVRSELMLFEGQPHGFFNEGRGDGSAYRETVFAMDEFLASLGFLEGKPTIEK